MNAPVPSEDQGWQPIESAPERTRVMTKIDDAGGVRNEQWLVRFGRLWFTNESQEMYVYYTPTHWRPL